MHTDPKKRSSRPPAAASGSACPSSSSSWRKFGAQPVPRPTLVNADGSWLCDRDGDGLDLERPQPSLRRRPRPRRTMRSNPTCDTDRWPRVGPRNSARGAPRTVPSSNTYHWPSQASMKILLQPSSRRVARLNSAGESSPLSRCALISKYRLLRDRFPRLSGLAASRTSHPDLNICTTLQAIWASDLPAAS